MISKTIKYKGFDGEDIEEVIRLNLTEAEVFRLNSKYEEYGGLINYLRKLMTDAQKDGQVASATPLITLLSTVILAAYGKRTEDGKFIKKMNGYSLADEFEASQAFSDFLMHLLSEEGIDEIEPLILGIFNINDREIDQTKLAENKAKLQNALGVV